MLYKGDQDQGQEGQVFPQVIGEAVDAEGAEGAGGEAGGGLEERDDGQVNVSAQEQIAELKRRMEDTEARYNALLSAQFSQRNVQPQEEEEAVNFDDLPDPLEKPDDFRKQLASKLQDTVKRQTEKARSQLEKSYSTRNSGDQLWEDFKSKHPSLADKKALVQGSVALEIQQLRAQGVHDVNSAIMADSDGFIEKVASRMKKELGVDSGDRGSRTQQSNRTAGVGTGSRSVPGNKGDSGKKPDGFLSQLKKAQLDSGLI